MGHVRGVVGERVLEVGGHRYVGGIDERRRVRQHLVQSHRTVEAAERRREPAAGRRQRLEAQGREQFRRARVPRIRHEERLAWAMELQEALRLRRLITHAVKVARCYPWSPCEVCSRDRSIR